MHVYGHPLSSCTRKVLVTLAEKGQKADFTLVDLLKAEHKAPAHLKRHPFGVVPVFDDDGFVLYESRAIIRYIDARFPDPPLTPSHPRDVARMDQWLSVDQSYVGPHTRTLAVERILKKHDGQAPDPAAERAGEAALGAALAVVDRALREGPGAYLAGPAFSLADVSLMPYIGSLRMLGAEHLLADRPHVLAWWERVRDRDSWRALPA